MFVDSRDDDGGSGSAQRVLVAKSLIPKGSSGDVVAAQQLAVPTTFKGDQVKDGAVTDPKTLQGDVATADIYPGQQITGRRLHDLGRRRGRQAVRPHSARSRSRSTQAHGLIGNVKTGDRVDVLAGFSTTSDTQGTSRAADQDAAAERARPRRAGRRAAADSAATTRTSRCG